MIEPDINEQMARFAPSQNPADPGFDAIEKAVAGMSGVPMPKPEPVDMDIDRAVQDIAAQRRQDMASSLMAASEVNPDEAAQADALGRRFGVGQDIALRNMSEMRRQAMIQDTERMDLLRKDPVLARYIADREFAAQASDDVGVLSMLRPMVLEAATLQTPGGFFRVVGAGYERGQVVSERGDIGAKAMAGFAEQGDFDRAKQLQERMQQLGQQGLLGAAAEMIAQNVSQLRTIGTTAAGGAALGSIAGPVGTVTGGTLGAAAGIVIGTGTMEAGNLYLDMRDQGVSDDAAIPAAIAGGFLNGVIEVVGMKIASAPFKALASKVIREEVSKAIAQPTMRSALIAAGKAYGLQVGGEAAEEGLQEIVAIASEEIAKAADGIDSETSLREATGRVIEAFAYGGMASALLGGIGPGANLVVDLRRANATQRQQAFFDGLVENRKESKLAQRNPQGYERFLAAQAKDTPAETIYVDAATARDILAQSGTTTAQLEDILPGIRERLEKAVETGGDVTIPTSQFGARLANTELGNALLPHMRLSPEAMSATEAQAFEAQRQAVVEEARTILATKQEADAAFVAEAQQVEDEAFEQVRSVGQFTDIEARTIAKLRQAMVVVDAAEAGMTPAQYQRERGVPLQVRGVQGEIAQAAPLEQAATLDADYLAAVKRGDMETAQRMVDEASGQPGQEAVTSDEQGNIVPLSRRFDITSPKLFEQAAMFEQAPVSPGFYSALAKAVDAIDAKSIAPSGWKERIKGLVNKGEVKQDEVDWSGLTDWLDMQEGKVTKEAVAEFLKNNGVRVERVQLKQNVSRINYASPYAIPEVLRYAQENQGNAPEALLLAIENDGDVYRALARPFPELIQREDWAQVVVNDVFRGGENVQQGKFSQYVLPGGTNYREVLITLPAEDRLPVGYSVVQQEGVWKIADNSGNIVMGDFLYGQTKEIATRNAISYLKSGQIAPVFQSSHWDQPNVLVHFRLNDRVDADGKRVLFVEEIQSDWGQQGRKVGFVPTATRRQAIIDEYNAAKVELAAAQPGTDAQANAYERVDRAEQAYNKEINDASIPRAPFVETTDGWLNLGLKHILLEATQGNYDSVAFVNGRQSADRYDLSKQVREVSWTGYDSRGAAKLVTITPLQGNLIEIPIDDRGVAISTGSQFDGKPLDEIVPKEIADQIMAERSGDISGEGLKVGGRGMLEFYDKIVQSAVNKLLKKYGGGKLGNVVLPNMKQQEMEADAERMGMNVADVLDLADSAEYAQAQPGFDITSELLKKLESGLPLFQAMPAPGPARGGFDPRTLNVLVGKGGDVSTLAHELIHLRVAEYLRMARGTTPPARVNADLETLFDFMGVEGATFQERLDNYETMTIDQRRPLEEKVTYNFEIYLYEGKAPSVELRGVFDRIAAWMRRVYKSIRDNLNEIYRREFGTDLPILTPEVRSVFDRMLASEEQIKRQEAIEGMKGLFQTQAESGMGDAEWAAYQAMQQEATEAAVTDLNTASMRQVQWLGNARARILRDLQKKHDAKRKEVTAEVAAAVKVEPVYRAMTYLRYGRFVDTDGAEVEVEGTHRLDIEKVRAMYAGLPSAEGVELIRATGMAVPANVRPDITPLGTGKYGMLGRDGLDPDMVAEMFGYSSGDEMVRALLAAKPMKDAVAERTDAEMLRRFGDMNTPAALETEVQKALHNEARARMVAVQLRFVSKAQTPVRVMLEAAKQVAADMISDTTIRNLRPNDFVAAEARAARDSEYLVKYEAQPRIRGRAEYDRVRLAALAAGSTEEDASIAATAAQEAFIAAQTEARSQEFRERFGPTTPQEALIRAQRAQLYQNQLAAEALRVKEYVDKQVKYLRGVMRDSNVKRMGAAAADQVAGLLERFEVAPVSLKRLDERRSMAKYLADLKDAGVEPDIADEITNEARRVNYKELKVSEFRDLVDAVKQIEHIGKNEQKMRLAEERAAFEEVRDNVVTRIRAVGKVRGLQIEPRSPLTGIGRSVAFLRGFAAQHLKAASIARILDGGKEDGPLWNAIIRTANDASDMETRMRAEASLKLGEILKPVFALGSMGGKGMYFQSIGRSLNREARIAIALNLGNDGNRQRLLDGEGWTLEQLQPVLESLTEAEWLAVQKVWDFIDGYRPEIAAKERRLYGKEPEWVKPTPFTVRTSDGKEVALQGGYYPVKYDPVASDRVATVDAVEEAKRELKGAYTAATTRRSFVKTRAKEVHDKPILYTLDAAFSGVNDVIHDLSWHEWLISTNRLLNDSKFANAVRETRGWEFLKQLRDWTKDNATGARGQQVAGEAALSWLRRNISASGLGFNVVSAAMQITGFNQSIVRVGAKYVGQGIVQFSTSPFESAKTVAEKSSFMAERGRTQFREINEIKNRVRGQTEVARRVTAGTYFLMMNMQRSVDIPTWLGAYQKALDAGKDDAKAVALADQAVRDSQGSGLVSDLSAMERGGPAMKLFTVFYSYMNTVYNMTAVQTMTARGKGKLAADYAMLLVVPVVLGYAIKSAIQPDAGDDELDPEALARKLAAEELSYLMGTMVIAREFGGAAQLLTGAEGPRMGYGGPAGLRAVGEVYGLATQAGQLEFDRAFRRSAINTLGVFTGLPSAQINRTIDGIEALVEGEVEGPTAVLAPLTGVQR